MLITGAGAATLRGRWGASSLSLRGGPFMGFRFGGASVNGRASPGSVVDFDGRLVSDGDRVGTGAVDAPDGDVLKKLPLPTWKPAVGKYFG